MFESWLFTGTNKTIHPAAIYVLKSNIKSIQIDHNISGSKDDTEYRYMHSQI